jgi:transcriptional regulator with XRE-family HTH domain
MTVPYAGRETTAPQAPKAPHRTAHNPKSATAYDIEIGRRVKSRRIECRLSQTDLSGALGITFQQLQKVEGGKNRLSAGRLLQIAEALNAPITYFFAGVSKAPDSTAPITTFELLQTRDAVKLLEAFGQITSDVDRKAIVTMAESLARK